MGREIRRVPVDFEHPTEEQELPGGQSKRIFKPCFAEAFATANARWDREEAQWRAGRHPNQEPGRETPDSYAEWAGEAPNPDDYLPEEFDPETATGWCLYEVVTEGTPITPVFESAAALIDYLATEGTRFGETLTRAQAEAMVALGSTVTGMTTGGAYSGPYEAAR